MDKPIRAFYQTPELPQVAHVAALRPFLWLKLGWEDLRHSPGPSIAHGLLLVLVGWLILLFFSAQIDLLAAAISGFLLLGPLFGAGFYELSRLRAAGQAATFDASLDGALRNGKRLASLGLVLAVLAIAWVMLSGLLFERAFGGILPSVHDNFYRTILDWNYAMFFVTYMTTGAILALIAFVLSVVSAPMIFDRAVDTNTAILTSLKVVATNPSAMAVWAILIAVLTAVGFATFLLGLAIVLPLLGHATWHSYRDLVISGNRAR
jgi:uncharacterized membrane protein